MQTLFSDVASQLTVISSHLTPFVVAAASWTYYFTGTVLLLLSVFFGVRLALLVFKNLCLSVRDNFQEAPFYTACTVLLILFVLSGLILAVHGSGA